jgi:hypothetical protein
MIGRADEMIVPHDALIATREDGIATRGEMIATRRPAIALVSALTLPSRQHDLNARRCSRHRTLRRRHLAASNHYAMQA